MPSGLSAGLWVGAEASVSQKKQRRYGTARNPSGIRALHRHGGLWYRL